MMLGGRVESCLNMKICWLSILLKVQKSNSSLGHLTPVHFPLFVGLGYTHRMWAGGAIRGKGSQMVKPIIRPHFVWTLPIASNILGFHVSPVNHDLGSSFSNPPKIPAFASCPSDVSTKKNQGGGFMFFKIFSSPFAKDFSILTIIFFRWVGEKPPTRKNGGKTAPI